MSMQYINESIRAKAESFLKDELFKGMTLAKLVLREIDFAQGQMFTWLPVAAEQYTIDDFEGSLRLSGDERLPDGTVTEFDHGSRLTNH
jgi:hypothetical protein